jgi:hypothetical protein
MKAARVAVDWCRVQEIRGGAFHFHLTSVLLTV